MGKTIQPPNNLADYDFFILAWDEDAYTLLLPNKQTYDLGSVQEARSYLVRVVGEVLADKGLDFAYSFSASMVLPKKKWVMQVDTHIEKTTSDLLFNKEDEQLLVDGF